jgi:hypothetical protein
MGKILIVRGQTPFREVSDEDVDRSLLSVERQAIRESVDLDTREYVSAIESGYWEQVGVHVREFANELLSKANKEGGDIRYFGIEEVPIAVALGAYLSDERNVECRDWDRKDRFAWPDDSPELEFDIERAPLEKIEAAGDVVIRVEVTSPIADEDVDTLVPFGTRLADMAIRPQGRIPEPGLVRSGADLDRFRQAIRKVIASIDALRPNTQTIHLFVAAPVSVAIATGQALRLRNGRPTQTYRFRARNQPRTQRALLLSPNPSEQPERPLTSDERSEAALARKAWKKALGEVTSYAQARKDADPNAQWPAYLLRELHQSYSGTLQLPSIWEVTSVSDVVHPDDCSDFYFDAATHTWHLGDRMMLAMWRAADGEEGLLLRYGRAFFLHEYLHNYQRLTRHSAVDVGGFPNSLERIDYLADLYSILHQADFIIREKSELPSAAELRNLIVQCITDAIDSFWTGTPPLS